MIFYRYLKLIYSFSISCNGIIEMLFIRTSGSQMCKVVKNLRWWLPDNYFYVLRGYVQWSPGTKSWTKWHMTDDKLIAGLWYHKRAQLSDKKKSLFRQSLAIYYHDPVPFTYFAKKLIGLYWPIASKKSLIRT